MSGNQGQGSIARGAEEARCKNCCRKLKGQKRRFAQEGLKACLVERRSSSRSAAAAIKPLTALRVAVLKGLESLLDWLHTLCTMKDERSSFSQPLVFRQELKDIGARHLMNSPRYSNRTKHSKPYLFQTIHRKHLNKNMDIHTASFCFLASLIVELSYGPFDVSVSCMFA